MAQQKDPSEQDIVRLKTKVAERKKTAENAEGDAGLRALHKRLKRAQRKKRAISVRLVHAQGKKKKKSEAKPAAAAAG